MRGIPGMVVLAVTLLSGCGGATGNIADYPAYATGAELAAAADVIVRGTALGSRDDTMYPDAATGTDPRLNPQAGLPEGEAGKAREAAGVEVTVTRVRVGEVFQGGVRAGDVIEVSQLRGEQSTTPLTEDDEYALVLAGYGPGKPYSPLNPTQAVFEVHGGELRKLGRGAEPPFATLDELRAATRP